MKLNLNFVTKTTRLGQDNEIIFFKSKKLKSKYTKLINSNIFSNKLFLEENFVRRDYNNKSFVPYYIAHPIIRHIVINKKN